MAGDMSRSGPAILATLTLCGIALGGASAEQKFEPREPNGLARTPPMGWNSWKTYGCNIRRSDGPQTSRRVARSGMKDAGYIYVVIDDCWQGERDAAGNTQPNPERFPSGIKALAEYVHSKGLKIGIYSDAGDKTCQNRPGSRGHEYQDAATIRRLGRGLSEIRLVHTANRWKHAPLIETMAMRCAPRAAHCV